jgi:hypothetical protein
MDDGNVNVEAEIGVMLQKPRNAWTCQKLEEAREDPAPKF